MMDDLTDARPRQLFIIAGLSGAGKSTTLRVFEDLRYFAVDGLPAGLAPEVAAIMEREPMRHFPGMAIGMDMRQDDFLEEFNKSMVKLATLDLETRLIFLEADDKAIMRRYAATRRPHPLEINGLGLEAAIAQERKLLRPLKDKADLVINSTDYSIHDLRRTIQRHLTSGKGHGHSLRVNLLSFGFKYGMPSDADFIFDLRFLDNPYFVDELRPLSGKDKPVVDYIFRSPQAVEFRDKLLDLVFYSLDLMEKEGRYRVTIAFGCTGGRHRSVAMTENLAQTLRQADYPISVEHRNLDMDAKKGDAP